MGRCARSRVSPWALGAALTTLAVGLPGPLAAPALAAPQAEGAEAPRAPSDNEALATELFGAGRELLEAGRVAEACPKLAESAKLDPRVGTLGNLADCEEKLGRLARARGYWQQAANLARSTGDARLGHAEAQLTRLDARVPKVRLVAPPALPPGLVVRLDRAEVGAGSFGTPMPLDPGRHAIEATAPGRSPWKVDVELLDRGETVDVTIPDLPLVASSAEGTGAPVGSGAHVTVETGPSALGIVGLASSGIGLVGLGVGTYFAGVAQSRADLSNELGCVDDRCTEHAAEVRTSAREAGTAATALFLAGGALAVGGLVTYLLAPEATEEVPVTASRPRFVATIAPPFGEEGLGARAGWQGAW